MLPGKIMRMILITTGGLLGAYGTYRRPFERNAVRTAERIQMPPGTTDCWQVGRRPLDIDFWGVDKAGEATKNFERFNFNHVHLVNKGKKTNVGFFSGEPGSGGVLKSDDDRLHDLLYDTKFGNLCMDPDLMENAMENVSPGNYFLPFNNCQDYVDRLLEYIEKKWKFGNGVRPGSGGGGGGGGGI